MAKPDITFKPERTVHIQFTVRPSIKSRHKQFLELCHKHRVDVIALMSDNLGDLFDDLEEKVAKKVAQAQIDTEGNGHSLTDR